MIIGSPGQRSSVSLHQRWVAAMVAWALASGRAYAGVALPAGETGTLRAHSGGSVCDDRPSLRTTRAMLTAGGWPGDYKTLNLIGTLAGSRANDAVVKLVRRFGAPAVKTFIKTSDFAAADALRLFGQSGIVLPSTPEPDPKDGKALVAALNAAGTAPISGKFDVECMLDRLLSHRLHVRIVTEITEKYGVAANASSHRVLLELMRDLQDEELGLIPGRNTVERPCECGRKKG